MFSQMTFQNRLGALVLSLVLAFTIVSLLRSGKISPQHAVVWILAAVGAMILVLCEPILHGLMFLLGATNVSSTMFLMAIVLLIFVNLDLLVRVSDVSNKLRLVNQDLGLLRNRYEQLEKALRSRNRGASRGCGGVQRAEM